MSEPVSVPATEPAVDAFAAFEARENAIAIGQSPEPKVVADPEPDPQPDPAPDPDPAPSAEPKAAPLDASGKAYTPPNSRSKRTEKDQAFINERIRTAVAETAARAEKAEKELAELRAKAPEPKAEPAPAAKPDKFTFPSYEKFLDTNPNAAYDEWELERLQAFGEWKDQRAEAASEAKRQKDADDAREADFTVKSNAWIARRDAYAAAHPEFAAKTHDLLGALRAGTLFGDAILESEVGPQMAQHLAEHPEEVERIAALSPNSALRALGKIEAIYETPTTSASASAGPAAKIKTTAPTPPTTLAARSASPADPAKAALERRDFPAWEDEENRKALAAAR